MASALTALPRPGRELLPSLNGLRALCVLLVFSSHLDLEKYLPGGLGVGVFFYISGFLITGLLLAEFERSGSISLPRFYAARVFRLFPALICALFAYVAAGYFLLGAPISANAISAILFYYANYLRIFDQSGLVALGFQHAWSLSVEEHFYLLYPILVLSSLRYRCHLSVLLGLILVIAPALRVYHHFHDASEFAANYNYNASETRMDLLGYGCLSTCLLRSRLRELYLRLAEQPWAFALGIAILLASLVIRNEAFRDTLRFSLQGMAMFLLVPPLVYGDGQKKLKALLNAGPTDWLGRISYSFYLYHPLCIKLTWAYVASGVASASLRESSWIAISLVFSIAVAALSFYCIEQPALRLRRRLLPQREAAAPQLQGSATPLQTAVSESG